MGYLFQKETSLYVDKQLMTTEFTKNISENFAYAFWRAIRNNRRVGILYDGNVEVMIIPLALEKEKWAYESFNRKTRESLHGVLGKKDLWQVLAGILSFDDERIEEVRRINSAIKVAYDMYKVQWIKRKKLDQILNEHEEYFERLKKYGFDLSSYSFNDHLNRYGYHGEMYSPLDYFLKNEMMNKEFMRDMIYPNTEIRNAVECYWYYSGSFEI